jgi:hypothetical protein
VLEPVLKWRSAAIIRVGRKITRPAINSMVLLIITFVRLGGMAEAICVGTTPGGGI